MSFLRKQESTLTLYERGIQGDFTGRVSKPPLRGAAELRADLSREPFMVRQAHHERQLRSSLREAEPSFFETNVALLANDEVVEHFNV
jgi:hypothetical protein